MAARVIGDKLEGHSVLAAVLQKGSRIVRGHSLFEPTQDAMTGIIVMRFGSRDERYGLDTGPESSLQQLKDHPSTQLLPSQSLALGMADRGGQRTEGRLPTVKL